MWRFRGDCDESNSMRISYVRCRCRRHEAMTSMDYYMGDCMTNPNANLPICTGFYDALQGLAMYTHIYRIGNHYNIPLFFNRYASDPWKTIASINHLNRNPFRNTRRRSALFLFSHSFHQIFIYTRCTRE